MGRRWGISHGSWAIFSAGRPVRDKTGLPGSYDFTLQPIDDEPVRGGDPDIVHFTITQ